MVLELQGTYLDIHLRNLGCRQGNSVAVWLEGCKARLIVIIEENAGLLLRPVRPGFSKPEELCQNFRWERLPHRKVKTGGKLHPEL